MAGQTVTVSVLADTKRFSRAMKGLGQATGLNKLAGAAKVAGKALAIGLGAGIAGAALITKKLISAGEAAATSNSRIANITNQMGLFGDQANKVSDRLVNLANKTALSTGEDQNAIKAAQAKLLTFKEIARSADQLGGIFDRTTQATIDLAAAGFGTAEDNATQLGKALNDPITGLSALTRSGITFTASEKDMIKAMVEAGDTAGAQEMILKAIESQVGGTAAATRNATDRIKVAWSVVQEYIGLKLLPILDKLTEWFLDKALPVIQTFGSQLVDRTLPILKRLGDWFKKDGLPRLRDFANWIKTNVIPRIATLAKWITGTLIPGMVTLVKWLKDNKDWLTAVAITIGVLVGAWKAYTTALAIWKAAVLVGTTAQAAFNTVMALNPIGLIIVAIAALVAGLVYFFTQTETGKKAWKAFTDGMVTGWEWLKNAFQVGVEFITTWLGKAWDFIQKVWSYTPLGLIVTNWDKIIGFFREIPGKVKNALLGAALWLVGTGKNIIDGLRNGIAQKWAEAIAWVRGIGDLLKSGVGNLRSKLLDAGKQLIEGLKSGITSAARGLAKKVLDPIKGAVNGVKNFLGIRSPSRLFRWIAEKTVEGAEIGFEKLDRLKGSMRKLSQTVTDGFNPSLTANVATAGFAASPTLALAGGAAARGGNHYTIEIKTGVGDPVAIGREVSNALAAYERVNGGRR